MTTKHTPGSWTAARLHAALNGNATESEARLIAAAPELLAELQHLVRLLGPQEHLGTLGIPGLATLNGARAAISKAQVS